MNKNITNSLDNGLVTTLTNLILFETNTAPDLVEDKFLELSINFLYCANDNISNDCAVESDYFLEKLNQFYSELDNFNRKLVWYSMFTHSEFMTGMMFIFLLEKDLFTNENIAENQALFHNKFIAEMNKSETIGVLNIYILRYFQFIFNELFYVELSNETSISKKIYDKNIKSLTQCRIVKKG